jgi:hypothetical protein
MPAAVESRLVTRELKRNDFVRFRFLCWWCVLLYVGIGDAMIEQFNRILQAFGSNRVLLISQSHLSFEIVGWGTFAILSNGVIVERNESGGYQPTANSMWLYSVSLGKTRNDAGEVA